MSKKTDEKFQDVAKWFYYNEQYLFNKDGKMKDNVDLAKAQQFGQDAIHNFMFLLTYIYEDVKVLEGQRNSRLILPRDMVQRG